MGIRNEKAFHVEVVWGFLIKGKKPWVGVRVPQPPGPDMVKMSWKTNVIFKYERCKIL